MSAMTQSQKCGDKKTNTTKEYNIIIIIILYTVTQRVSMYLKIHDH